MTNREMHRVRASFFVTAGDGSLRASFSSRCMQEVANGKTHGYRIGGELSDSSSLDPEEGVQVDRRGEDMKRSSACQKRSKVTLSVNRSRSGSRKELVKTLDPKLYIRGWHAATSLYNLVQAGTPVTCRQRPRREPSSFARYVYFLIPSFTLFTLLLLLTF